jgi:hypothetical protein
VDRPQGLVDVSHNIGATHPSGLIYLLFGS